MKSAAPDCLDRKFVRYYFMSMASPLFAKYFWYAKRSVRHLGVLGNAGLVVTLLSVVFYFAVINPQKKEVGTLRQSTEKLQASIQASKATQKKILTPQDQLADFYRRFPNSSAAPDWLDKIYAIAKAQNLILDKGEYQLVRNEEEKIARYEIVLPLKGSYVQIRRFVNQVLQDMPSVALQSVSFERQRVGDASVQSQVKLILFLGEGK